MKLFAAGEALFLQGARPTGLHSILSGQAQVIGLTAEGVEVLMAILRPGEWTGFLACLDGGPYAFTVAASEPTEVFSLSYAHVQRLFLDNVEGLRALATPELSASRKIYADLIEFVTLSPLQRLARRVQQTGHTNNGVKQAQRNRHQANEIPDAELPRCRWRRTLSPSRAERVALLAHGVSLRRPRQLAEQ